MDECLEEALRLKAKELRETLFELKKQDFDINVERLKSSLPKRKRCVICTLKLPCKHFRTVKEMPKNIKESSIERLNKSTEEVVDFSKFVPNFPKETEKIGFIVNYRGRERKYYIDPHFRTTSLPNEKRFNLLCTIEAYREEKLQEEIKKLEVAKQEEEKKVKEKSVLEEEKKKYLNKQKERLLKHREEVNLKREELRNVIEEENEKKKVKEKKMQKYYESQKKTLIEYQEKKRLSQQADELINQIDDLGFTL